MAWVAAAWVAATEWAAAVKVNVTAPATASVMAAAVWAVAGRKDIGKNNTDGAHYGPRFL